MLRFARRTLFEENDLTADAIDSVEKIARQAPSSAVLMSVQAAAELGTRLFEDMHAMDT